MTHGELFAGISGFGIAFERAGIQTAWRVEIDPNCQTVLKHHYPDDLLLSDIHDCGAHNLDPVDIITFGSPCQDLSVAGKRAGLDGKRSGLFYEAIRIVGELKPTFAIWENVPGAFSSNSGRDFLAVLTAFRELGASDIAWRVLNAEHFGVPQRRRRIFLVADFAEKRAAEILLESESLSRDTPQGGKAGERVTPPVIASLEICGTGFQKDELVVGDNEIIPAIQSSGAPGTRRDDEDSLIAFQPKASPSQSMNPGSISPTIGATKEVAVAVLPHTKGNQNPIKQNVQVSETLEATSSPGFAILEMPHSDEVIRQRSDGVVPTLQQRMGTGGNQVPMVITHSGGETLKLKGITSSHGENLQQSNVMQSITTQVGSESLAMFQGVLQLGVRRLTPRECEFLQGFSGDWTAMCSDSARYRMLGNAVAVPVAEWIARRIPL